MVNLAARLEAVIRYHCTGRFSDASADVTAKQKKRRAERVQECNQIRESRKRSTGQEIESFLTNTEDSLERQALVQNLSAKDHKDAKAWILERHLQVAKQYQDVWTDKGLEHIYQKYILSPRIWLEEMTDYRTFILEFYTENQKKNFRKRRRQSGSGFSRISRNIRN